MKLLYCQWCGDIFNLQLHEKQCSCGKAKGKYLEDGLNAVWCGNLGVMPFMLTSSDFKYVASDFFANPTIQRERAIRACGIPYECKTLSVFNGGNNGE